MYCFSDSALLAFSLGVCTVVVLRWKSLPADVQAVHTVLEYSRKLMMRMCASRPAMSEHISSEEHFPRPPRTADTLFSPDYVRTPSMTSLAQDTPPDCIPDPISQLLEPQEDGQALTRAIEESSSEAPTEQSDSEDSDVE